jgi:uncharacterized YccA/Bax inhibitor family protein
MSNHSALNRFGTSGNPVIRSAAFNEVSSNPSDRMTLDGAVNKTGIMLAVLVSTATIAWNFSTNPLVFLVGEISFFAAVVAAVMTFGFYFPFIGWIVKPKPYNAPKTWLVYSAGQGFFLGFLSLGFETAFPGIVLEAVSLTFFVAGSLLFAYKSGIIKPTQNFLLMVFAATMGIFLFYIFTLIYTLFTGVSPEIFSGSGNFSIGISLFVVGIAALNLVLDFDIIEQSADNGAPKYMEYFGSMALMATLIWLYIEILRLLAKMRQR